MNKSYRSIWNEKVGTFVAVAETAMSRGKKSSGGAVCDPEGDQEALDSRGLERNDASPKVALRAAGVGASVALLFGGTNAFAVAVNPAVTACVNGSGNGYTVSMSMSTSTPPPTTDCDTGVTGANFTGVVMQAGSSNPNTYLTVGADGVIKLAGNQGVRFAAPTISFSNGVLSNVANGSLASNSTDAV